MPDAYCTVSDGDTYFTTLRVGGEVWSQSIVTEKQAALYQATRILETLRWGGFPTCSTQTLAFPRNGITTVPQEIKNATLEIALSLLDGIDMEAEVSALRRQHSGFSSVRVTYDSNIADLAKRNGVPSYTAWMMIFPFLAESRALKLRRV